MVTAKQNIQTEFELITRHVTSKVELTQDELSYFLSQFEQVKIKKRQFIVQPEFTAKYQHFVVKGAFRSYIVGDEGEDTTIQFAVDDWWITDYNSYYRQELSTMFIVALEDSVILRLEYNKEQQLKKLNHKYESYFNRILERCLAYMQRRIVTNLSKTAEERLEEMLDKYPQIVQRVPQYALASYLGMTTEYLSKIRNKKTTSKS